MTLFLRMTFAAALVVALCPALAHAQPTRTWVSGVGDDANPCSRTAPCKTFGGAISKTATNGEINVLDPGGFGAVTITKSITISSENFEAGVLVQSTNAIIVNSASARVVLRGLDIVGVGTGINGVNILEASSVHIENCVIRGFETDSSNGVLVSPSAGPVRLTMDNVILSQNGGVNNGNAITIRARANQKVDALFNNVRVVSNASGFRFDGTAGPISAEIRNSVSSNNVRGGMSGIGGNAVNVLSDGSAFTGNATGVNTNGAAVRIRLRHSTVTGNATGINIQAGAIQSYGDNVIDNNASEGETPSPVQVR